MELFTAALSQYLPYGHFAPAPFLPPPLSHLTPALETLAGSRALTALAQAQKRLRESEVDEIFHQNAKGSKNLNKKPHLFL